MVIITPEKAAQSQFVGTELLFFQIQVPLSQNHSLEVATGIFATPPLVCKGRNSLLLPVEEEGNLLIYISNPLY